MSLLFDRLLELKDTDNKQQTTKMRFTQHLLLFFWLELLLRTWKQEVVVFSRQHIIGRSIFCFCLFLSFSKISLPSFWLSLPSISNCVRFMDVQSFLGNLKARGMTRRYCKAKLKKKKMVKVWVNTRRQIWDNFWRDDGVYQPWFCFARLSFQR